MKGKYALVLLSAAGLALGAQSALAADAAVREMAGIMLHLNHYASDEEKGKLKVIADDPATPQDERVIAAAVMNLEHQVSSPDRDKLKKVIDDNSAPPEVRDLAAIVLNTNHTPSEADKRRLEAMTK